LIIAIFFKFKARFWYSWFRGHRPFVFLKILQRNLRDMYCFSLEIFCPGPAEQYLKPYLGAVGAFQTPPTDAVQRKFGCNLTIDTLTGKMMAATIDARAAEDAVPVREGTWESPADPSDSEGEWVEKPIYFYDNYTDIFPADLTVGHFCELLAEYWGFSGYRLAETVDSMYFDEPQTPVDPGSLLKDLNDNTKANYYLTVFFEGDQEGAPMYIQLHQFPGYVSLMVGTGHAVG